MGYYGKLAALKKNPHRAKPYIYRRLLDVNQRVSRWSGSHEGSIDVMDADWDTLVILDGCRADTFREVVSLPDGATMRTETSPASESKEFLDRALDGTHHDTVYTTANPHHERLSDGAFHAVCNLLNSSWDDELGTVPPDAATDVAIDVHEEHPDKRHIIHYMQPHFPFIGPTDRKLGGVTLARTEDEIGGQLPIWRRIYASPDITHQEVVSAYRENLELVWSEVERLRAQIDGDIVVTSDHGNLLGERTWPLPIPTYGHPENIRHPNLVSVPWCEFPGDSRRHTTSDTPAETRQTMNNEVRQDRLQALGYVSE